MQVLVHLYALHYIYQAFIDYFWSVFFIVDMKFVHNGSTILYHLSFTHLCHSYTLCLSFLCSRLRMIDNTSNGDSRNNNDSTLLLIVSLLLPFLLPLITPTSTAVAAVTILLLPFLIPLLLLLLVLLSPPLLSKLKRKKDNEKVAYKSY